MSLVAATSVLASKSRPSGLRHDWTRAEVRALFDAAVSGADVPSADASTGMHFDPSRGADFDAAVDQDRRLPGGLRLLPAERALRHRRQGREADEPRRRAGRGARRQGRRRQPLLHGRGLARAEGPRPRERLRHGRGREGARARDLRHARHADAGAGAAAEGARPRLLQPQPRHLAGVLRRDHHHAHLSGPPRHARRTCATPASMSAAAASSAWARARRTAPA